MKNLQVIDTKEIAVIDYNIEEVLAEFKKKHTVLAVSNNKERNIVQKGITELTTLRTNIEKRRKVLKADALEFGRKVDAEAARVTGLIEAVEQPLKDVKQAYDDEKERSRLEAVVKEQERIEEINTRIASIRNSAAGFINCHSYVIDERIVSFTNIYMDENDDFNYMEFAAAAQEAKETALNDLRILSVERRQIEREKAEEEKRQEQAAADRIKLEAEQATLRAEQQAFEEKQAAARQAEESRIAAAQKAERDAEHARRQEELKRQQEENARLAKIKEEEIAIERQKIQLEKEKAEHEAKMVRDEAEQESAKQSLIVKAAPDMLDALEKIIKYIGEVPRSQAMNDILGIAQPAVNKAKGQ